MNESYLELLLLWNVAVFLLYGFDKWCAMKNKWRISEKTLICAAFLMGAAGAMLGMKTFRHKTRKKMFSVLIALAFLANAAAIIIIERM